MTLQVYPPKFKTEEKRAHMTLGEVDAYNRAILNSSILVPAGPFHLLDMHHLTQGTITYLAKQGLCLSAACFWKHRWTALGNPVSLCDCA